MNDRVGRGCVPGPAAALPDIRTWVQHSGFEELLQLYLHQGSLIRSILIGDPQLCRELSERAHIPPVNGGRTDTLLLRLAEPRGRPWYIVTRVPLPSGRHSHGGLHAQKLAQETHQLLGDVPGADLLLSPAHSLNNMMTPGVDEFGFTAVAALSSRGVGDEDDLRQLRRGLFDRGLICIGSVQVAGCTALCFLTSAAVRSLRHCHVGSNGHVSISELVNNAGFANQLFRYAYVKLYALRHGVIPAFPAWDGDQLFGLEDESCAHLKFRRLTFNGFTDHHLLLWAEDHPPIDIDLNGYFQELPRCWQRHRPLLRHLFELAPEQRNAIDAWRHEVTAGGERTLVAIHVRRGDYRQLQLPDAPWFRLVPERWYLDWLRRIWPTLRDPLLFVATDEPDALLPEFAEFDPISASFDPLAQRLPPHVRDFEALRRADYLAICNSSFSRMAAILASSAQKCFLPSFQKECFVPYEPWIDAGFWERFQDAWGAESAGSHSRLLGAVHDAIDNSQQFFKTRIDAATIYFDISDLLLYLLHHTTLSGIQRVQCEILCRGAESYDAQAIRFVVTDELGGLAEIDKSALLNIIKDFHSDIKSRARKECELRAQLASAKPCAFRARDIFITIGAFWAVPGMGRLLQRLKNFGVVIGVFIHDILPITAPEYFQARDRRIFVKGIFEVLTFADFVLTSSEYNKGSLAKHTLGQRMEPLPIQVVPLAREIPTPFATDAKTSRAVVEAVSRDYVLCVGTIEVRKNPTYLFHIWKLMVQSGRAKVPTLVFAGRRGWLVQDFLDQLTASNYLDGKIVLLHDLTDAELDLLYRKCILTMFPSLAEGWGLPVGESLAYGKVTLSSDAGGIPEVGGKLLDYLDPYNVRAGLALLLRYLDDPSLRHRRQNEVERYFESRSWQKVTQDFLSAIQALANQVRPCKSVAAITLPPNCFMPVCADAASISMDAGNGALSAELACVSGWQGPRAWGVQPDALETILRFRASVPAGKRVTVVMRLAVPGMDCCRIRVSSGCGAQTEVSVKGAGSLAVLSCEIEPDQLITIRFSTPNPLRDGDKLGNPPCWILKEFLYIDRNRLPDQKVKEFTDSGAPQSWSTRSLPNRAAKSPDLTKGAPLAKRVLLPQSAPWDYHQAAISFGAFLQAADSYWQSDFSNHRGPPIFVDHADRQMFYSNCGNNEYAPRTGEINETITLMRRSNQYVSMSRFTEGSIFDRSGTWRGLGYLKNFRDAHTLWLSNAADGLWLDEQAMADAPFYEKSYLIFFNGNLQNYYHWMVEGLLSLDILSRTLGFDSNVKIALPKSRRIAERFDHRDSLKAVGLDRYDIVDVAENLIKVQEAIWVDSGDLVEDMPAAYVKDFQKRVAVRYAGLCGPRNRRLFIARKGPTRTIDNIEQVQALLGRYEFETVYLEDKSIIDQILLFQSAQFVVGAHGAGLSNLLFCEPGTKVIEFMPSVELRPYFWLLSDKLALLHGMQFCTPSGPQGFQSALTVDVDKLERLFRMLDAHF
jgi:glycosyltransferase involved in cell wall biosynthesis